MSDGAGRPRVIGRGDGPATTASGSLCGAGCRGVVGHGDRPYRRGRAAQARPRGVCLGGKNVAYRISNNRIFRKKNKNDWDELRSFS